MMKEKINNIYLSALIILSLELIISVFEETDIQLGERECQNG